jgi:hypothetical protein
VIGNSAGETCGCRHAVDAVSQRSATPRRAPTWLHPAVDQARLPQICMRRFASAQPKVPPLVRGLARRRK